MSFQRAVEYLLEHKAVNVEEYANPQSDYQTKGISLNIEPQIFRQVLQERNDFIRLLLRLYQRNMLISEQSVRAVAPEHTWDLTFWFSVMETENVLNLLPGRAGQYSLFRTHHTVNLIADEDAEKTEGDPADPPA